MTDEEKILLRQKWEFRNIVRTFKNFMGEMEGLGILDFRTEGILILSDGKTEFNYKLVDRSLEIFFTANPRNALRLRICELTSDKLTIAVSGKRGDEQDDKFRQEFVELYYTPILDN